MKSRKKNPRPPGDSNSEPSEQWPNAQPLEPPPLRKSDKTVPFI